MRTRKTSMWRKPSFGFTFATRSPSASMSWHVKLFQSCRGRHLWSEAGKEDRIDQVCLCWATTELKNMQCAVDDCTLSKCHSPGCNSSPLSSFGDVGAPPTTKGFALIFKQHIVFGLYITQLYVSVERTGGNCVLWTVFWRILLTICHFTWDVSWRENGLSYVVRVAFKSTLKVYNELDDWQPSQSSWHKESIESSRAKHSWTRASWQNILPV